MIAIKPKYKTKQYYKKRVTKKTLENKPEKIKYKTYYVMVLYHSLVRGQYLHSRAKPVGIALNYLLIIVSLLPLEGGQKEYPWCSFDL